jgi:hypothetical protein
MSDELGTVGNLRKVKYQSVEVDIVNNTDDFKLSFETDRLYAKVKGIAFQIIPLTGTPNTDFLKLKKADIQSKEIYPNNFYVKQLETSNDVPFNKKFDEEIDEPAAASKVDFLLKDDNVAFPGNYKVILTLKLANS